MADKVTQRIGFVGAGALGCALLERLILAGVETQTYDVSASAAEAARRLGCTIVESPKAAAKDVDRVHVCVRTDEQMLEAVLGTDGVLSGMRRGAVLILHSTVLPETTWSVAELAAEQGIAVIDAAVVGVPGWVRAGNAAFLVGGDKDVADAAHPHLLALGRVVYYFGPLGSGNVAKIAKNLVTAVERVVFVEVLALAEAGGLDPRQLLNMMRDEYQSLTRSWEKAFDVANGHAELRPPTNLLDKDIQHAATFATERALDVPVTTTVAKTAARWVADWKKQRV